MIKTPDSTGLYQFENLKAKVGLRHFVTSRQGGVSQAPYQSMNLGLHTADNTDNVLTNRNILANVTGIGKENFLYASQIHSGDVLIVDEKAVAVGILTANPPTDAMVTNLTGICLMVMVADCVPVLLYDASKRVTAVIHAGWRGTVKQITVNTIHAMVERYACRPEDILAAIGPSIGPCCFEVGNEVKDEVIKNLGSADGILIAGKNSAKPVFDLWSANRKQLIDSGVKPENIETAACCTKCNNGVFYSSRAASGITGRFAAGMYLEP